jgi:hypothetical protein
MDSSIASSSASSVGGGFSGSGACAGRGFRFSVMAYLSEFMIGC